MSAKEPEYSIKEIQSELLILMKIFHKLCMDNDIKYSVHAGTMIGAVREHGFIPWDDDADISFTRREYNRFRTVIRKKAKGPGLFFSEYDNAFPQLWMHRKGKPAVWLDFFIYDYISENRTVRKIKHAGIAFFLGIMKTKKTMELTKARGLYKGGKYLLIYILYLAGKPFPSRLKHRAADVFHQSLHGSRQLIHRANDRYIGIWQVYPKSTMQHYMLVPFEDTKLMITKDYHRILVSGYGRDYMTPKKEEGAEGTIHEVTRMIM